MFRQFWWAFAVFSIMPSIAAANSGLIQVTNIRSFSHAGSTRVILDTTGRVEFRAERTYNPDRLFFDISHARPWIEHHRYATRAVNDALVRRIRVAETAPGTTRIVFDLMEPAFYKITRLQSPQRMVIELTPMKPSKFEMAKPVPVYSATPSRAFRRRFAFVYPAPAVHPRPRMPLLASMPPQFEPNPLTAIYFLEPALEITLARPPRRRGAVTPQVAGLPAASLPVTRSVAATTNATTKVMLPPHAANYDSMPRASENAGRSLTRALGLKINRVVIDAGHGGHDEGTVGPNGILEKDVVLDVALRVAKLIQNRMGAEVVLTRSDDTFIPLHERTAIANEHKADLFLSIHANSSPSPAVAGTETFFLNFTNNASALDVASRENAGSDKSVGELKDLIQSITLNDKITESQAFAQTIQTSLSTQAVKSNGAAHNRGVKRAPFVVLIGASMPSVLAEIGFLSNARDEANLAKPEYRQKVAEALYKGVSQYSQSLSHFEVATQIDKSEKGAHTGLN
jgi:N-acetylmuramoyl-L-alanine amidase